MTTDLTMLTWTAGLTLILAFPYVFATIARYGIVGALTYRADGQPLSDWAARAKKAHYNAIENLAPFAVLVIVAHLTYSANEATAAAAIAYFWARVVHYFVYMANIPLGRTLAFVVGWLAMACIFWQIIT
jgi:uncharacterized MAPEG superfamily protein